MRWHPLTLGAATCSVVIATAGCVVAGAPQAPFLSTLVHAQDDPQDPLDPPRIIGAPWPDPEPEEADEVGEESEILEKRRAGAEDTAETIRQALRTTTLYWDYGPRLDTLDGDLSVIFGGRLQLDGATFGENAEIENAFGPPEEGFEVRRAFLEIGAVYRNRYEARLMVDFTETIDFRDVFVGMLRIPVIGGIRIGYFKEPFGLEEIESSNDIAFLERSLTDALVDRRNLGVMLHRRTPNRRGTAWLGAFRDADNELNVTDGKNVTGRVTMLAVDDPERRRLIHLGVAGSYRLPSQNTVRHLSKPESNLAQVLVDTGPIPADREVRLGLETAALRGPLSIQTEFMLSAVTGQAGVGSPVFPAFYFMGGYILTGEQRPYRRSVGAFGRVYPETKLGAWEVTGRYSYLDLDSAGVQGGVLHDVTAGLTWYPNFHMRVMFNYIAAHPEGFGIQHIAQIRLQVAL